MGGSVEEVTLGKAREASHKQLSEGLNYLCRIHLECTYNSGWTLLYHYG